MSRILGIGIATLDIINTVHDYPEEDTEVRALQQRISRGGNAANSLVVLSQLGHQCDFSGVISDDYNSQIITADLNKFRINSRYCQQQKNGKTPTSYITLNQLNGSRSIIHYRDLAELSFSSFTAISLQEVDWLHFEGRNIENTVKMLRHAINETPHLKRSIEIEKPRTGIEQLFPFADVLIFSKHYLLELGHQDPAAFLSNIHQQIPDTDLICTWGEKGAWYHSRDNEKGHQPAKYVKPAIDTLGAGDCFNAGLIDGLLQDQSLAQACRNACKLAAVKCGLQGLNLKLARSQKCPPRQDSPVA